MNTTELKYKKSLERQAGNIAANIVNHLNATKDQRKEAIELQDAVKRFTGMNFDVQDMVNNISKLELLYSSLF
ncbi:MAG: hypothetical protein H7X88_01780 [Gloeobacteraceae cyanobacterium ES-bin-316]|nr:hypothetical protein [Ferruginibacter sp.]